LIQVVSCTIISISHGLSTNSIVWLLLQLQNTGITDHRNTDILTQQFWLYILSWWWDIWYIWGFSCLDYSPDILYSWTRQLSLYNGFAYSYIYWMRLIHLFISNSGCIHSVDGEVRYMVYRWGCSCLNYSLDVLISWN